MFSFTVSVSPAVWREVLGPAVKDRSFLSIQLPGSFQRLSGTQGKCYYSPVSKVSVGDLGEEVGCLKGLAGRRLTRASSLAFKDTLAFMFPPPADAHVYAGECLESAGECLSPLSFSSHHHDHHRCCLCCSSTFTRVYAYKKKALIRRGHQHAHARFVGRVFFRALYTRGRKRRRKGESTLQINIESSSLTLM